MTLIKKVILTLPHNSIGMLISTWQSQKFKFWKHKYQSETDGLIPKEVNFKETIL